MDAAAIQSCIAATLDADADVRRRAELQLKQVRLLLFCGVRAVDAHPIPQFPLESPPPPPHDTTRHTPTLFAYAHHLPAETLTLMCVAGRGPAWFHRCPPGSRPVGPEHQSPTSEYVCSFFLLA
jgi:hypothetical protein